MRYFLMGFMGSGKSTLGKRLARYKRLPFVDMDDYIEEQEGRAIPAIFEAEGENGFRLIERKKLQQALAQFPDAVIALGGGTPCNEKNIALINQSGTSIYLEMPPLALAQRLQQAKTVRPLIQGLSPEELVAFIRQKLAAREPFYKQAHIHIDGHSDPLKPLAGILDNQA